MKPTLQDVKQEALRAAFQEIANANEGFLRPKDALEAAKKSTHILHDYLEWDDSTAGEQYRLAQISGLIRHVKFYTIRQEHETKTVNFQSVRQYHNLPSGRNTKEGYEDIVDIMMEDEKRLELLNAALKELEAFEKKYAALNELSQVIDAIHTIMPKAITKAVAA